MKMNLLWVVHQGTVRGSGSPACRDDVVDDELPAGVGGEPEREGAAQRLAGVGVEAIQRAPVLRHGRPGAAVGLHEVDGAEVAVVVLELDQDLQVERVRALVHPEGDVHATVLAWHPTINANKHRNELTQQLPVINLCRLRMYSSSPKHLPLVLDLEDAAGTEFIGHARLRHGAHGGAAHVEVSRLDEAGPAGARVGDDDGRRLAGARRVAGGVAFNLRTSTT